MAPSVADVTASLTRCLQRPEFVDGFLLRLADQAPELGAAIRAEADHGIKVMAQRCMTTVIMAVAGSVPAAEARRKFLGCRTSGGAGMTPDLYPVWARCLKGAVEASDPDMNPALARAWEQALNDGGRRLHLNDRPHRAA